jgi:hypothetical protein
MSAEPAETGSRMPGMSTGLSVTGAEPLGMGAEPSGPGSRLPGMSAEPSETGAEPSGMSAEPLVTGSRMPGMGAEPLGMGAEPLGMSAEPLGMSAWALGPSAKLSGLGTAVSGAGDREGVAGLLASAMSVSEAAERRAMAWKRAWGRRERCGLGNGNADVGKGWLPLVMSGPASATEREHGRGRERFERSGTDRARCAGTRRIARDRRRGSAAE